MYKLPFLFLAVILAKAGIQCFQYVLSRKLSGPVKPEDDKYLLYTQTLITLFTKRYLYVIFLYKYKAKPCDRLLFVRLPQRNNVSLAVFHLHILCNLHDDRVSLHLFYNTVFAA